MALKSNDSDGDGYFSTDSGYFSEVGTEKCAAVSVSMPGPESSTSTLATEHQFPSDGAANLSSFEWQEREVVNEQEPQSGAEYTEPLLQNNSGGRQQVHRVIRTNLRRQPQFLPPLASIPEEDECESSIQQNKSFKTIQHRLQKQVNLWEKIGYDIDTVGNDSSSACCVACCNVTNDCFREQLLNTYLCKCWDCNVVSLSERLIEAQKKGWIIFRKIVFPLVRDIVRDIWVIVEFVCVMLSFALSLYSICHGKREVFNIVHFVFTVAATILVIIDTGFSLASSRSFMNLFTLCKNGAHGTRSEHGCIPHSKTLEYIDVARSIVSELLFYPLLVCDIMEFVTGKVYQGETVEDKVSLFLFVVTIFEIIVLVYITRLLLLGGIIYNVHEHRKPLRKHWMLSSYAKSALHFQGFFFVHVVGQMLVQMMIFVSIGAKIYYDNIMTNEDEDQIHLSSYLWYMIISGYILPVCGFFSFFIVTSSWVREFPIGVCIDVMQIILKPEVDDLMYINESVKSKMKTANNIAAKFIDIDSFNFKLDLIRLSNVSLCTKLSYPFYGPITIGMCCIYSAFQLAFLVCGAKPVLLVGSGGWVIFYRMVVFTNVIANAYVYLVAYTWFTIIGVVLAIVLVYVAIMVGYVAFLIVCFIIGCFCE